MQRYRRLALEDRISIQVGIASGVSQAQIAKTLGFHKSTVSREIKRHLGRELYRAQVAQLVSRKNFSFCRRRLKLRGKLWRWSEQNLRNGWSPEQLELRLARESSAQKISYQTVYRMVHRLGLKKTHLHFGYKRRGFGRVKIKANRLKNVWKRSIHERPQVANDRSELGHWERDTIFDQKRKSILILVDRKSRFVKLKLNPSLRAPDVARRTIAALKNLPAKTMTNDNGSEFFDTASLKFPTYFCDVLKPGQRGTVENTIGLLRRFLKRTMDFSQITQRHLRRLEDLINHRPRKCLDCRTPYEVFYETNVALAV